MVWHIIMKSFLIYSPFTALYLSPLLFVLFIIITWSPCKIRRLNLLHFPACLIVAQLWGPFQIPRDFRSTSA